MTFMGCRGREMSCLCLPKLALLGIWMGIVLVPAAVEGDPGGLVTELIHSCNFSSNRQDTSFLGPLQHKQVGPVNFAYYSFGPLEEIMGNASQQPFPTLLIITGYSATTSSWPPKLLRDLAQDRAIIFADNPGIGFSTTAENTSALLLPAQADAYADLITALGLGPNTSSPKPSVMGWSMGGAITLELAAAHGAMFDKFITIAGFSDRHFVTNETYPLPELASAPEGLRDLLGLVAVLFPNTSSGVAAACDYLQGVLSMPPDPASPESIGRQLQGIVQWGAGVRPRLEGINNSVLVFQGGADVVVLPPAALPMVEDIPNASLIRFPEGGHGVVMQCADAALVYINQFLS